jgi:hypothetical protein
MSRREVDQLLRLMKPPRRPPAFGRGPELVERLTDSIKDEYIEQEQERQRGARSLFERKEQDGQ